MNNTQAEVFNLVNNRGGFLALVLLSLATYRITRFLIIDDLIEAPRMKFHVWLANRKHQGPAGLLLTLTSCCWCASVHVAYLLYAGWFATYPWDFGVKGWIYVAAIAGASGMVQALEPEED